jgi:polygalacturonase
MMFRFVASVLTLICVCGGGMTADAQEAMDSVTTPFGLLRFSRPDIPKRTFDIRSFGATEGGRSEVTQAIAKAIHAAAAAGGGRVLVPPGRWLTGAIHFESNIDLHLERGAELLFSQDPRDYLPVVFSRHEDTECYKYSSFLYADEKHDIAVTGEGVLDGQGEPWWRWKTERKDVETALVDMANRGVPVRERVFDGRNGKALRPAFFQPMRCRNVLVEGVTFRYGAFWTITPTYCENVVIRRVSIETDGPGGHVPNGDGVDPSSSRNVLIEECRFSTGDDCVAIKSGRDADGRRVRRPTENVVVRDCTGRQGHGGIVIGSETAGGIRNVYATDCRFSGTDRMIRIKTQRGRGGVIEHLWFRNIEGDSIGMEAIRINMLYSGERLPAQPVTEQTPVVRDLHFSDIAQKSGKGFAVEIRGIPEMPVERVTFDRIQMHSAKGVNIVDAKDITFVAVDIASTEPPVVRIAHSVAVSMSRITIPGAVRPFLSVEGEDAGGITVIPSPGSATTPDVSLAPGVPSDAVVVHKAEE